MKKGFKKVMQKERTVFNDEEQRRYVIVFAALRIYSEIKGYLCTGSVTVSMDYYYVI